MMLSRPDHDLLRNTKPGTPNGDRLRRVWHPILSAAVLAEPGSGPVPVRALSEDLAAFRDSTGRLGLVREACPHRGLPLSHGINANGRLTCRYHGWAFDVTGACVDDLPDADRWRVTAYPVHQSGGLIWAYLGPPEQQPPPPDRLEVPSPSGSGLITFVNVRRPYLRVVEENLALVERHTAPGAADGRHPVSSETANILPLIALARLPDGVRALLGVVPIDDWSALRLVIASHPAAQSERTRAFDRLQPLLETPSSDHGGTTTASGSSGHDARFSRVEEWLAMWIDRFQHAAGADRRVGRA
jgi:nitrite reductase/ring-hydroxylating ferredoxin subunit